MYACVVSDDVEARRSLLSRVYQYGRVYSMWQAINGASRIQLQIRGFRRVHFPHVCFDPPAVALGLTIDSHSTRERPHTYPRSHAATLLSIVVGPPPPIAGATLHAHASATSMGPAVHVPAVPALPTSSAARARPAMSSSSAAIAIERKTSSMLV